VRVRGHGAVAVVSLAVVAFLWAPIVVVVINSVNADKLLVGWGGATFRWYREAIEDPAVRDGLVGTLEVAALTTVLSLVVAISGGLWWRRASARGRRVFDGSTYLRIILPEIVFALSLFLLFTQLKLPLGVLTVVIGHTVWNSAYAALVVQARVTGLDPALEEAAADLGAPPHRVFRRVTLPGLMPGIAAAGVLVFAFSADDVITTLFLGGTSVTTLPLVMFGLARRGITPEVNAIGSLLAIATISLLALAAAVFARASGRWRVPLPPGMGGR
jgi:ABC-type spermidine/putrescine transport system permease subunit II